MPSVEPSLVQKVWLGWKAGVPVTLWDDLTDGGIRVAPRPDALIYPYPTPNPQGSMRRMAKPTVGKIILTCLRLSVAAVPVPSWRTTSQPSTPSGTRNALCAG